MTGTVYLGGGGSPEDERELWLRMLPAARRVLSWPFALSGPMLAGARDWLAEALDRHGFAGDLEVWTTLQGHHAAELSAFDLLFVGGGNTFRLLHQVRTHEFIEPVRQYVRSGGAYYGGSAGAILACDDIATAEEYDANDVGLTDLGGLGLISRVALLPHYEPTQHAAAEMWAHAHGTRLLGVPERSGLIAVDGVLHVVGSEPVWSFNGLVSRAYPPGTELPGAS